VYLGLTPSARGRGLGDLLVRQALATTAALGASRLSLAVDSQNGPALKLYYRHGLQRVASKLAMMRLLNDRRAPQTVSDSDTSGA
jgi:ribosomal protein S18 acetylase RimI-like enzyme